MHPACVLLNDTTPGSSSTIVVSGLPRSGTSLVAAALKAGGLWLGDNLDEVCFEDVDIAHAAEHRSALAVRAWQAARAPSRWRAALSGVDLRAFGDAVSARDALYPQWGFKRPNIVSRLGRDGLSLLRDPRLILCFRDPVALAQRSVMSDGVTMVDALRRARRQLNENLKMVERLPLPTLLVSFEKTRTDSAGLLRDIYAFCGLHVPTEDLPRIGDYVERAGLEYKRVTSGPVIGCIDRPFGWTLSGWCCPGRSLASARVDVIADGTRLQTLDANLERPDLAIAGFRSTRHGFILDLRHFGLKGSETIDVVLSGTTIRLGDSGFALDPQ